LNLAKPVSVVEENKENRPPPVKPLPVQPPKLRKKPAFMAPSRTQAALRESNVVPKLTPAPVLPGDVTKVPKLTPAPVLPGDVTKQSKQPLAGVGVDKSAPESIPFDPDMHTMELDR